MSSSNQIPTIIAGALFAVLWVIFWGHFISRLGYRGALRKWWLVGMCIPPFFSLVFIAMVLLPWPVRRQLKQFQKQLPPVNPIEDELKRMRDNG
jgi:MFS family permease